MDDIYDYLHWRGDLSFDSVEPSEIDMAIFSLLSYIDYLPDMNIELNKKSHTLNTLIPLMKEEGLLGIKKGVQKFKVECIELLTLLSTKNRFKDIKVFGFAFNFEKDNSLQFAAISFILPTGDVIISFRGTDASLIGWKEDFMMSFKESVGAQEYGNKYLKEIASLKNGNFYIVGHSKGGNVALYSALKANENIKERIKKVYSFDGPGFNEKSIQKLSMRSLDKKMVTLVPQGSVVGILMQHEEPIEIIYSNKKNGIAQHSPFSWEINVDKFKRLDSRDKSSLMFDKSIRLWLEKLDEEDMETFINSIFDTTEAIGLESLDDLKVKPIKTIHTLLSNYSQKNASSKKKIERIIGSWISSMKDVTTSEYENVKEQILGPIKKGLKAVDDNNIKKKGEADKKILNQDS